MGHDKFFPFFRRREADVERQTVGDNREGKEVPALVLTVPNDASNKSRFPAKDGKQFLPVSKLHVCLYDTL